MSDYIRSIVAARRPSDARSSTQLSLDNSYVNQQSERWYRNHPLSKGTTVS